MFMESDWNKSQMHNDDNDAYIPEFGFANATA